MNLQLQETKQDGERERGLELLMSRIKEKKKKRIKERSLPLTLQKSKKIIKTIYANK